jgi:hypothetical protein
VFEGLVRSKSFIETCNFKRSASTIFQDCYGLQTGTSITRYLELEAKKWLLNEGKCQQQEVDKPQKLRSFKRDPLTLSVGETCNLGSNHSMPNQYARVKNAVTEVDDTQDQPRSTYSFIDVFLEDAIKSSNLC